MNRIIDRFTGKLAGRRRLAIAMGVCLVFSLCIWPGAERLGMDMLGILARTLPAAASEPYLALTHSGEVQDRHGELLYAFTDKNEQWSFPRALDRVSPHLIQATLAAEDKRFYIHPGVDPWAALRAIWQNVTGRRITSGASTLTMQVVKRIEDTPRTMRGKLGQMFSALRLEHAASKQQILETYLNAAPYGANLIGVEAASRRWFGKPASELVLSEAALLAGLPKSPTSFNPLRHPDRALFRRNLVLSEMRKARMVSKDDYEQALTAPLGVEWHSLPHQAPHLAMRLRSDAITKGVVPTIIDAEIQGRVQAMAARSLQRFNGEISNVAVMVIDVGEGGVLARVGSAEFFSNKISGQVDLCRAPRSPGSTLKPFTYALAMERQQAYPTEQLLDGTLDYGGYNPGNFDGNYNGLVTATEALRLSLNVPAVMLLDRIGVEPLCAFLRGAGFTTITRPALDYGLGLTIGDCEVTLESLADAYLMLARLGDYQPARIRLDAPASMSKSLLSRGTALALYQMLDQPFPAELDRNLLSSGDVMPRVCWKTGTSAGFHDAWAVAFNRHYLVVVWMGNNDGRSSRHLIGAHAALPVAAHIFRSLPTKTEPAWPDPANDLVEVKICSITGLPASPNCSATESAWISRNQFLHRRCAVHQPDVDGKVAESWPADARHWDLAAVPSRAASPTEQPKGKENNEYGHHESLAITSPPDKAEFILTGQPNGDKIELSASRKGVGELYWYLNDRYIGKSDPEKPLYMDLISGAHRLICMDNSGETVSAQFTVHGG